MKKLFCLTVAFMAMATLSAQTMKEDIDKSVKRAKELQELLNSYQGACGIGEVDGFGTSVKEAAALAIGNSEQLENFYYREIGETKDGVTDVTVNKPSLDDWVALGTGIAGEGLKVKEAVDKAKAAGEALKAMAEEAKSVKNPMKAAKLAKQLKAGAPILESGNKATPILLEESGAQLKAVQQIIETLKSGKNL